MCPAHAPRSQSLDEGRGWPQTVESRAGSGNQGSRLRLAMENKAVRREPDRTYALTPLDRLRAFADRYDLGLVLDTIHAGIGRGRTWPKPAGSSMDGWPTCT